MKEVQWIGRTLISSGGYSHSLNLDVRHARGKLSPLLQLREEGGSKCSGITCPTLPAGICMHEMALAAHNCLKHDREVALLVEFRGAVHRRKDGNVCATDDPNTVGEPRMANLSMTSCGLSRHMICEAITPRSTTES